MRIALIGCGKQKAHQSCAAESMYRSPLFKAALRYALMTCDGFFILSAKHGLLSGQTVIEPYEQSLAGLSSEERRRWGRRVGRELDHALPWPEHANVEIVFLAGELYSLPIEFPNAREFYWDEPLRGLGIGERIAWLKAHATFREAA